MKPVLMSFVSLIALGWTASVQAQDAPQAAPPPADQQEEVRASQLDEIVVTAQRREQSLQEVPIAVTSLSASSLSAMGISGTEDIASAVPGVTFTHQLITAAPAVRGIGQANGAPGDEPPTAIYVDGVYLAIAQAAFFSFNNLERVEVLKGPQGTLFGRNAAAGVINIITKTPSYAPSLDASLTYANYQTVEGKLYATTGLTDTVAADIAVYWRDQGEGWGTNLFTGDDAFLSNEFSARSKLVWELGEASKLTLTVDYGRADSDVGVAQHIVNGAIGAGGATFPGFYNLDNNVPTRIRHEQWGVAATLDHDLEWALFKAITSYRDFLARTVLDADATPTPVQRLAFRNPAQTFTQEMQLLSPKSSRIDWIVGAFYLNSEAGHDPVKINTALAIRGVQTTESISGFGQVTVPFGDRTNVTGGLRYTHDKQEIIGGNYTYVDDSFINNGALLTPAEIHQTADFGKFSYKLAIDHDLTADILAYASYSRGFKSGLFNTASPADPAVAPQVNDQYEVGLKSEFFDRRVRINTSAFIGEISGVQLQNINAIGLSRLFNAASAETYGFDIDFAAVATENLTINGGLAYTHAVYDSFPNAPLFTPNPTPACPTGTTGNCQTSFDASGMWAILTPEWAGNIGFQYRIPSSVGEFTVAGNVAHTGKIFWMPDNRLSQPGYNMINGSVTWTDPMARYSIRLWVNNLADEEIYLYQNEKVAGDVGSPDAPRTFGITLSMRLE